MKARRKKEPCFASLSRARNKIILERAPALAQEALRDVKRLVLSDELVEILVGKGVLYPPLAYSHVPEASRYAVELGNAMLRRLPGKWGNLPPHVVPRPTAAKDARARRSWLALWFWLARSSRGIDARLDAAARARVKAEVKAKPNKPAKRAAKEGKR